MKGCYKWVLIVKNADEYPTSSSSFAVQRCSGFRMRHEFTKLFRFSEKLSGLLKVGGGVFLSPMRYFQVLADIAIARHYTMARHGI